MSHEVVDFDQEVLQRSHQIPVLVDFWAPWCAPCRVLGPLLERLAQENNNRWILVKVNTDQSVEVAQRFGIRSIPNVKLFVDGNVADEFVGALPEHALRLWLQKAIPSRYQKQLQEAQRLFQTGQKSEAQLLLEEVVQLEPDNALARVLLAQLILFQNPIRAEQLLENVEDLRYSEITEAVRTIARLRNALQNPNALPQSPIWQHYLDAVQALYAQDFDTALRKFIQVIRSDRYYDDDGARKASIAIFKVLGEEHEITLKHRRDFSSSLYV